MTLAAGAACIEATQRLLHAVQQQLFVVWFFDKVMGTGFECAHHNRHVCMATDEDDRQVQLTRAHFFLHIQPAHAGHAHIQQHTGVELGVTRVQESEATGKRQCFEAHRLQQPDGRIEHALIVIDHIDHLLRDTRHSFTPDIIFRGPTSGK